MKDSHLLAHHIRLLNGRIFQKLLSQDPEALYRGEQGKILAVLWNSETGCATATDIALATGLANNTLTTMIKKLEEQKLVIVSPCGKDKRKKYLVLTELGKFQKEGGIVSVRNWILSFTKDFQRKKFTNLKVFKKEFWQI
ncbi:transcriptional regulator, MarR family [Streptococcus pneumoniae]|nr:transcriptional regulator, MarR family [Streptococcus pneumoniae]